MSIRLWGCVLVVCVGCLGCISGPAQRGGLADNTPYVPVSMSPEQWVAEAEAITKLDARLTKDVAQLHANMQLWLPDGFTSQETELAGEALFRFAVATNMLWEKVAANRRAALSATTGPAEARAFMVGFAAAAVLGKQSSAFVEGFSSQPVFQELKIAAKLNERYQSYDLGPGMFDAVFYAVTSTENIKTLETASEMLAAQLAKEHSQASVITTSEQAFAALCQLGIRRYQDGQVLTRKILKQNSILFPNLNNQARHHALAVGIRTAFGQFTSAAYGVQGWLYSSVSDIKRPGTGPIDFNLHSEVPVFELVLLAEENPESTTNAAKILQGETAAQRLAELM